MIRFLLAMALFAAGLNVWADAHESVFPLNLGNPKLVGRWLTPKAVISDKTKNIYFGARFFANSTARLQAICVFSDRRLEAVAQVPVRVTETQITLLASARAEVSDGEHVCQLSLPAATATYTVDGNRLTLNSGGSTLALQRR